MSISRNRVAYLQGTAVGLYVAAGVSGSLLGKHGLFPNCANQTTSQIGCAEILVVYEQHVAIRKCGTETIFPQYFLKNAGIVMPMIGAKQHA
jgi:hypothetical protein